MTSGIYAIKNIENEKFYVGSAVCLERRRIRHWTDLRSSSHHNEHLQRAWDKYGEDVFEFEIVVECGKADLIWIEQAYLDYSWGSDVLYNLSPSAGHLLGYEHTDESKDKIRNALQGNQNALGYKFPEEIASKRRGESNGQAKLTKEKVNEIRRLHKEEAPKYAKLAKQFNVHYMTIFDVINRRTWSHI